jgi:hypothetical protein
MSLADASAQSPVRTPEVYGWGGRQEEEKKKWQNGLSVYRLKREEKVKIKQLRICQSCKKLTRSVKFRESEQKAGVKQVKICRS